MSLTISYDAAGCIEEVKQDFSTYAPDAVPFAAGHAIPHVPFVSAGIGKLSAFMTPKQAREWAERLAAAADEADAALAKFQPLVAA